MESRVRDYLQNENVSDKTRLLINGVDNMVAKEAASNPNMTLSELK